MADYNTKIASVLGTDVIPEATINRTNVYEQLYTVSGRTIVCPAEMQSGAGIAEDVCTEVLKFRIPRFWDGHDLAQHIGKILFVNALGESDEVQIVPEVSESCINFEWCLDSKVTKSAGTVNFAIRFETINTETQEVLFRWTTLPCTFTINAGLAWSDEEIAGTYPTILEQWLQNMTDLQANVQDMMSQVGVSTSGVQDAIDAAVSAANNANSSALTADTATLNANNAADNAKNAAEGLIFFESVLESPSLV